MNAVFVLRMPGQLIQAIDAHELAHFTKPARLWDRVCNVLPKTGEVELMYVMASNRDQTVSIIHRHNGEEQCVQLPIAEKGSLGQILFLHCLTTLPVWMALNGQHEFEYIYYYHQKLANDVIVGDPTTYPQYVARITPQMASEVEGEAEWNMFRFVQVGESRDPEHTVALRACVRYVARSVARELSTNFNEVYPVVQFGPYVTFNSYIPHPAQILGPFDNENTLPIAEDYGLFAKDAVIAVSEQRVTLHALHGLQEPEVPYMSSHG
ncbi:hypothetical protein BIZ83_gp212 [Erwinia phage vB_EamM_ChrisDB]|uniref:hypothetical protein n=1 Tax=Erwinia phage vB_EamM_ChrisDB TaxID=1883371 RepID=UPI00081CCEC4|nr:hypothetical protein BIZ83_gp212 [Erwinia phage vB_EamM_ChrisDB]ANZ48641.1 hypothetical protein CHRISDB_79 [Erwinia phage vB_EamM_ChrisDB]